MMKDMGVPANTARSFHVGSMPAASGGRLRWLVSWNMHELGFHVS